MNAAAPQQGPTATAITARRDVRRGVCFWVESSASALRGGSGVAVSQKRLWDRAIARVGVCCDFGGSYGDWAWKG